MHTDQVKAASTMPTTPEGKAISSANATKHGILAKRLFLADEAPEEFAALQDGLRAALHPVGQYELLLVERMAVTIWRQRRLIRAETAGIELRRAGWNRELRHAVERVVSGLVSHEDFEPLSESDHAEAAWCRTALAEFDQMGDEYADVDDLDKYPTIYEQANQDAEGTPLAQHFAEPGSLSEYLAELQEWCRSTLRKYGQRETVSRLGELARQTQAAPITDELLSRYTTTLDNELVKIARELREAQAWRQKALAEVPAEEVKKFPVAV